ncbi:hypothetical protein HPP92_005990 [Vanilla planifolia]|uniref:Uncharacterized protein n=1 Tax=Vanilla planifolia TaxID=51239 RepID=A0A835VBH0_VANPL|nr:hypothetical protein HPP92_005990 [Vanilla planifolia]
MSSRNNSPLPKTTRGSFASIDSDCRRPKVSERKPSPDSRSSKEKPVVMRVSEMQQSQLREELKRVKEELSELKKKKTQGLAESNGRIMMLEAEAARPRIQK